MIRGKRHQNNIAILTAVMLCAGILSACSQNARPVQTPPDMPKISEAPVITKEPADPAETVPDMREITGTPAITEEPADIDVMLQDVSEITETVPARPATEASVTMCLMGDIMCLSGQQRTAVREDGTHDYRGCYGLIKPVFDECDFVVGNLETCLSKSAPYSTAAKNIAGNPNCNAPDDLTESLVDVGITHVVTANNHSMDAGTEGIAETLAVLDAAGIVHTGTQLPDSTKDRQPGFMMLQKGDLSIAVISVTELINRRSLIPAEELLLYVNQYSSEYIASQIAAARGAGARYVIVYEHWGSENTHEVRSNQKEHARQIAEAGADLIIGSHPHCLQPFEIIQASDGREVPCYYSLGNLVSSMSRDINHDTVLVRLELSLAEDKDNGVNASITNIPCHMLWTLDGVNFVVTPTDYDTGNKSRNTELKESEERIGKVLANKWKEE